MRRETEAGRKLDTAARMTAASGKMLLLSKLLPKLRSEGRKVLIFSQFKIMLDVLEDYLDGEGWPHERIDGSTPSRDRQAAIDRFSAGKTDSEGRGRVRGSWRHRRGGAEDWSWPCVVVTGSDFG